MLYRGRRKQIGDYLCGWGEVDEPHFRNLYSGLNNGPSRKCFDGGRGWAVLWMDENFIRQSYMTVVHHLKP